MTKPQEVILAKALKMVAESVSPGNDDVASKFYAARLIDALAGAGWQLVQERADADLAGKILEDCPPDWEEIAVDASDEQIALEYVRQLEKRCDRLGISRHRRSPLEVD